MKSKSESGDTLVEILIALSVIGVTAVALLGAFATSISASNEHRNLATLDTVLKSFAETATFQIQQQSNPLYASCASTYTLNPPFSPPANYSVAITGVTYWTGTTFASSCSSGSPNPQQITATATNTSSGSQTSLNFVVADPSDVAAALTTVTGISPNAGPAGGGTTVAITGTGFTGATSVTFGAIAATFTVNSDTSITATSPGGTGTVPVSVSTPRGGTSPASSADQFTYGPTVTGIAPAFGPAAGGTTVVIQGTGFAGLTGVRFGGTAAASFTFNSASQITATSPAGSGTVDVLVTTPSGTSPVGPADTFAYAPTVTGVTPNSGPGAGGTSVTITGTGFTGATGVKFGTTSASFTVNSANSITTTSPVVSGTVDITVITPAGTSPITTADRFTSVGAATKLVFTTQPVGGVPEATNFATSPTVSVEDANGNVVTSDTGNVTLAIATGPGAGSLICSNGGFPTVAAIAGVASFTNCQISGTAAAGTYTLHATRGGLATATSNNVVISAGTATKLVFTTSPGGGANGAAWTTQPVVTVEDASGNTVTSSGASVTLAIASQPGSGASLTCTGGLSKAAASGVASFGGCQIVGKPGNYSLSATATGLGTATSSSFSIGVGAATQLVFTTSPGGGANGAAWTTQPVVTVEDSGGNTVTSSGASVTLAIASQPGSGASLTCTGGLSQAAASGVASFGGCQIVGKAGNYTLSATATGLSTATSSSFGIGVGPAALVTFTTQPGGGANGAAWTTQPVVTVEDSGGNTVTSSGASVTLAIASQPGSGASLTCTGGLSQTAASGVASFGGCQIVGKAGNYTLSATATGLGTATSNAFTVSAGTATKLVFTTSPGGGANGAAWTTQPVVTVEDASGNTVTSSGASVTLAIASQPGSGASLTCTGGLSKAAASGVASFGGCQIVGKAGNYSLSATATGLGTATSSSFSIGVGAATQLVFTTSPGGGANGAAWTTQPVVTVEDSGGNTVTSSGASVTLAIASQPGSGASLTCTGGLSQAAASGVASFGGCQIVGKAGNYTLSATATGLSTATSSSFGIGVGPAALVTFTTQPGGGANGAAWTTQPVVTVEDSGGNTVTSSGASVTLAIASQPGSGASLTCTGGLSQTAASGVASFGGCQIVGKAGNYTLSATATGLGTATSNAFTVSAGAATQLVFTTQPVGGKKGNPFATQPVVTVEDSLGNTVTNNSSTVTLAIGTNPSGGTLTCPGGLSQNAVNGVVNFSGCSINKSGAGYTLTAADGSLTPATSSAFTVSP